MKIAILSQVRKVCETVLSSAKFLMLLSRHVEEAGFSKSFFPYFELQSK